LSEVVTPPQFLPSRVQKSASVSAQPHTFEVPPPPHVTPVPEHAPHELTVLLAPHLSVADMPPQFLPSRVQISVSVSVQPHTFAVPPPPQVTPVPEHVPHELTVLVAPHLSVAATPPQFLPSRVQSAASVSAQPHTFGVPPPPQVTPVPEHVPHELTVLLAPHVSVAATVPQFLPSRVQSAASVSAQPHTLVVPPPPHVTPVPEHDPQFTLLRAAPQLSVPETVPQVYPSRAQNVALSSAVQPHTLPAAHVCVPGQVPHGLTVRAVPQLSVPESEPHTAPSLAQNVASASGVQVHTFALHELPDGHAVPKPQSGTVRLVEQLSFAVTLPQFFPLREQNATLLSGWHPHTLATPPPPQVLGDVHGRLRAVAQSVTERAVPQLSTPETVPQSLPRVLQNSASPW
jgi:hypothetical protein